MTGSAARPSRYWELTVPVSSDIAEGLTNFLWELGALGVVEEERPADPARVRAFFPETLEPGWLHERIDAYLRSLEALGFAAPATPHATPLVDEGWAEAWREHFRPIAVGRRLVVAPPWEAAAVSHAREIEDGRVSGADGRVAIIIDPGRAFGTGHHATTAGCLEALESLVDARPPGRVLDLGTGSGVLGIAAARLGATSVLAIDSDPDAVAATETNAELNGVSDRVRAVVADGATVDTDPVPLVLANLLAAAHVSLAARYADLVAPGGHLVLGGILEREAAAVADAVDAHRFTRVSASTIDGWTTLVLRRDASAPAGLRASERIGWSRSATALTGASAHRTGASAHRPGRSECGGLGGHR
ncbi:MAG: 50S ribosomal protein L11 methyltransferase [Candidatus Rokubacteria bacterium]|nr:50S ribosomal protein L11 methyltransferase [Candidatus Rokubacteria bacterium]